MKIKIVAEDELGELEDELNRVLDDLERDEMHVFNVEPLWPLSKNREEYVVMIFYQDRAKFGHFGPQPGG